jgi:poly(hydroxyalkanoate) depolymerase family esterase
MKTFDIRRMFEATRLTRAGRLSEAVALLQGAAMDSTPSRRATPEVIDGEIVSDEGPQTKPSALGPLALRTWDGAKLPVMRRRIPDAANIAPAVGRFVDGSFSNSEGMRSYKLYIPSIRNAGSRPLIVMLHGCSQSADDFAAGTRMNFAAEEHGCFVVFPEQPQAANASKCWNWFRPSDQKRGRGEPSLIAGITHQIAETYDIDRSRVYVAGLSAGGAAAAIMGEAYPDLYAAVGVHSGLACGAAHDVTSAFNAMRGAGNNEGNAASSLLKPTIVFHGDRDTTVHPCNGARVIARVGGRARLTIDTERERSSDGRNFSRSVHRDATGASVLELWELHDAGHAWSGGSPAGSFTRQVGPEASREMLRFFLQHRLASS